MTERVKVWQCIGCGRIEGPKPCIGVCEDRLAEYVAAEEHDAALAAEQRRVEELAVLVRQIAFTTPRAGETDRTWLALQARAREVLGKTQGNTP
jgi:hypothetical protein